MALLYRATLTPSKIDVIRSWLPRQPWAQDVDASAVEAVGSYRFDDPVGEVGVEVHLVRAGDATTLQVPLTYRAEEHHELRDGLVGTAEHSALGTRWFYDGCIDPVFVNTLLAAMVTGGREAPLEFVDGGSREPTTRVVGSGTSDDVAPTVTSVTAHSDGDLTTIDGNGAQIVVPRRVGIGLDGRFRLRGTWPGQDESVTLAVLR